MKILVIGAGGIGSYLAEHLYRIYLNGQVDDEIEFEFVDNDSVEKKNVKYQNFTTKDVLSNKAEVISDRYGFLSHNKRIESEQDLEPYDGYIICVDNSKLRKLVYDYVYGLKNKFFIDLRAEGRQIAVITSELNKKEAMATLPKVVEDNGGSCQLKYRFDNDILDYGNVIIAAMGAQMLLNYLRRESYNPKMILKV